MARDPNNVDRSLPIIRLPSSARNVVNDPDRLAAHLDQLAREIENHWHPQAATAAAETCPLFCGAGSPEGVIVSPVGGLYEQTDAASTSHSLWVKISGTGNTGWRAWAGLRGSVTKLSFRIGDSATATQDWAIAIGESAAATAANTLAIGKAATAAVADVINVGRGNTLPAFSWDNAIIAIGSDNVCSESGFGVLTQDIIIGSQNTWKDLNGGYEPCVLIGQFNDVDATATVAIGAYQVSGPDTGVARGALGSLGSSYGVSLGSTTSYWADCYLVMGYSASAYGIGPTAVGPHTVAGVDGDSLHCTALGRFAKAKPNGSTALGAQTTIDTGHTDSVAIGNQATTKAANQLMIGGDLHEIQTIRFAGIRPGINKTNYSPTSLNIYAPRGTGTGTGASIIFNTGNTGSTGTTLHTETVRFRINETAGHSVEVAQALTCTTVTADTTLSALHHTVLVNHATVAKTITLPTAASAFANGAGRVYVIKRIGAAGVTVQGNGSENIDTANTYSLAAQYDRVTIQSDGTQWWILST